jgi:gephyrin
MGDKDFIKPLLERKGTVYFGKVWMKPGKPLTFATLDLPGPRRMFVFGLPGNPVSSIATFNLFVLPALRKMAGWKVAPPPPPPPLLSAITAAFQGRGSRRGFKTGV